MFVDIHTLDFGFWLEAQTCVASRILRDKGANRSNDIGDRNRYYLSNQLGWITTQQALLTRCVDFCCKYSCENGSTVPPTPCTGRYLERRQFPASP